MSSSTTRDMGKGANKHPSLSNDTSSLIGELRDWSRRRKWHGLDPTPLDKAILLLKSYQVMYGNLKIEDCNPPYAD